MSSSTSAVGSGPRTGLSNLRWAHRRCRAAAPGTYALLAVNAAISLAVPAAIALSIRGLVNAVAEPSQRGLGGGLGFWLLVGFVAAVTGVVTGSVGGHASRRLLVELKDRLQLEILEHGARMSCSRLEDGAYQDDLQRALPSPEIHVGNSVVFTVDLAVKTIQALSLVVLLTAIEPLLLLLLLPVGAPYLWFQWRLSRRQFQELDERIEKRRWIGYYTGLLSAPESAAELRLLDLHGPLLERCRRTMVEFRELLLRYQRLEFLGNLAFAALSVTAIYLALARAALAIQAGRLTIGDLAIFASAAAQLRSLVESTVGLVVALRWEVMHVGNLRRFLALRPDLPDSSAAPLVGRRSSRSTGAFELRGVTFGYPDAAAPAVRDLSFRVAAGETVALVGENGAGKTTVAKLVAGLYRPDSGEVVLQCEGGTATPQERQRDIACVFQNFQHYAATAGDNIAFGDWRRLLEDPEEVEAVARRAGVHDLVAALPEGYSTLLGRAFGQVELSGGQWQHLALARALARDARIVILDEPSSNLDPASEARLFDDFLRLTRGRTTLLISHRFSTVHRADRILVLDEGRLVEDGDHASLMARGGRYARLYEIQRQDRAASPDAAS